MSTNTPALSREQRAPLRAVARRWPLTTFFVLAFAFSWIFLIADALGSHGILPFRIPLPGLIVMGYGPTFAAVLTTLVTEGRSGVRALLRRLLIWRVGWPWYAVAVFATGVVFALTLVFMGTALLSADFAALSPLAMVGITALTFVIVGLANGEEMGWRGYALPRLQARWGALGGSLILGAIWAAFHLPLFWTVGSPQAHMPMLAFLASTLALSIVFTWVFNNTRGSVLLAILLHASANTWSSVFNLAGAPPAYMWVVAGIWWLIALVLVAVYGPARLSRSAITEALPATVGL